MRPRPAIAALAGARSAALAWHGDDFFTALVGRARLLSSALARRGHDLFTALFGRARLLSSALARRGHDLFTALVGRARLLPAALAGRAHVSSALRRASRARLSPAALGVLLAFTALAPSARAGEIAVHWKGREHALGDPALPAAGRAAAEAWAGFAAEKGYGLDLDDEGRLLLVGESNRAEAERRLDLARRTIALFDRDLPAPPPPEAEPATATTPGRAARSEGGDSIPEDPEGPPPGWKPPVAEEPIPDYRWGAGTVEPDTQTIALLVLRDEEDYHASLGVLAGLREHLAAWAAAARADLGFVLEDPLAGAYVLNASGQEEWNPDNELVNHLAQLCLLRRFGQQPHWIVQGYAWHAEIEIQGGVYCFPHRSEFVWDTEHTGWDVEVARRFKDAPPDFDALADWPRGTYHAAASRVAWALVDWTLDEHAGTLSRILDDLRRFQDENNRRKTSDTTWERIPDYAVPAAKQRKMFQDRLGKSFLRDLADACLAKAD